MSRSLLRQLEQIRNSETYDDQVSSVNTVDVAEPTVSGTLEGDVNIIRTLIRQVKGTTNWYDSSGNYFDPTDTDGSNTENKALNLYNLKNNTLDAKTILVAVTDNNADAGYSVTSVSTGVLLAPSSINYADAANRLGLPIFASTANTGSYQDEGGSDNVCRIDVLNFETDAEFVTASGHTVYAKFHDGADFSGSGEGTDVYARFYANDTPIDLSTVSGVDSVYFVYPLRKRLSDMNEYDWMRTDFVSSWEGDVEILEDIQNLWGYTGASDGVNGTAGTWNNTTGSYVLQSDPDSLKLAIDALNDGIGSRLFTEDNYITDGSTITSAIDLLDQEIKDVYDAIDGLVFSEKYVESVATLLTKNVAHTLPGSLTYTPDATSGQEGSNMDVYVDGQLLAADTGASGANADRDYAETSSTQITFRFNVQAGRNITYVIRS